jgi:hypothetical protein
MIIEFVGMALLSMNDDRGPWWFCLWTLVVMMVMMMLMMDG